MTTSGGSIYPVDQKICAIGASAGGLAPVEQFFESIEPDTGLVFVLVQHLSPDHESMMGSLLSSRTDMPIQQAADGLRVQPDHVYLIPPGAELAIEGEYLVVRERSSAPSHLHRPIDVFFSAMAREYGRCCAGVILSGTGSDGTAGAAEISRAGGLVLVQDESAAFGGMPDAAQQSGFVDAAMAPVALAEEVTRFAGASDEGVFGDKALSPIEERIFGDLESLSGIDFSEYKSGTLRRRLDRRIKLGNDTLESYQQRTMADEVERDALVNDLLIDVTSFFRDREVFDELRRTIIPRLIVEATSAQRPVRVWVPGCATGEEAYSIAMLLLDAMTDLYGRRPLVKIFATDVHERALAQASEGRYSEQRMAGVPASLRDTWFDRTGSHFTPNEELRSVITFAQHNLLKDAPFTNIDLVSCRNMLIYFRRSAQDRALSSLAFALRMGGALVLGSSESLGAIEPDFEVINGRSRIWQKTGEATRRSFRPPQRLPEQSATITPRVPPVTPDLKLLRSYDAVLASQFSGALLLNPKRELLHTIGTATTWLRQPAGRPTLDAIKMIGDQQLRLATTAALRELDNGAGISTPRAVDLSFGGAAELHDQALVAQQLAVGQETFYLLYTRPIEPAVIGRDEIPRSAPGMHSRDDIDQLEGELTYVRESLESALEEQESSNEELNATNEELTASNEELQSTNEELSSVNEELRTLNDEHRSRLEQVRDLSADLQQLMSSTDIGVVFLNDDRTIRRFNEPSRDYFKIRDGDVGRQFGDVVSLLDGPDLDADIRHAASTGEPRVRSASMHGEPGRRLAVQVHRYQLPGNRWGLFVAVIDITEIDLTHEQRLLAGLVQSAPVAIAMWDADNRWVYANRGLATRLAAKSLLGTHPHDVYAPALATKLLDELDSVRAGGEPLTTYTPAAAPDDIDDFVETKFTFDVDGVTHVGGLAVLTDGLAEIENLKLARRVLGGIGRGTVVEIRVHDSNLEPVPALDVIDTSRRYGVNESFIDSALSDSARQQLRDGLAPVLASGRVSRHRFQQRMTDGSTRWVRVEQVPYGDGDGVATIVIDDDDAQHEIASLRDEVADLKAQLGRLATSSSVTTADLAQRNQDLDSFAHVAAHDLKAPIRSMRSFSELALTDLPDNSPAEPHIHQVLAASKRMGDLVDSLLAFATLGTLDITGERVTLDELLLDIVADLRAQIVGSGASIQVSGGGLVLQGDREALRQMFSNLVNNAIKYRSDERPEIDLTVTPDGDGIRIVIADNGIGFDPELATEMFEPFRRLHSKDISGSGVGLAICQRIAELLGGRIWATAEPGVGATFSLWLPGVVDLSATETRDLTGADLTDPTSQDGAARP